MIARVTTLITYIKLIAVKNNRLILQEIDRSHAFMKSLSKLVILKINLSSSI